MERKLEIENETLDVLEILEINCTKIHPRVR